MGGVNGRFPVVGELRDVAEGNDEPLMMRTELNQQSERGLMQAVGLSLGYSEDGYITEAMIAPEYEASGQELVCTDRKQLKMQDTSRWKMRRIRRVSSLGGYLQETRRGNNGAD
ncbi:hypothetical protein F0562_025222 [Nyssa sinensis]|uniref:Uncharacterized protein n=1 Tax=Nyssa sinensis TaxID=561372 RepID=A0A5J5BHA8_9ASTE|nr:hypothetical protein F0562_025222 [Nyssa sinensis]